MVSVVVPGGSGQVTVSVPADGGDPTVTYGLPGVATTTLGNVENADFLTKAIAAGVIDAAVTAAIAALVGEAPPLALNGTIPTTASVGSAYVATVAATGGVPPYSYARTGTLLTGQAFSTTTGAISGTVSAAGSASGTITVTDSVGATASLAYALTATTPSSGQVTLFFDDSTKPLSVRRGSTITANGVTWGPFSHYAMSNNAVGNYTTFEWTDGYATADPHQLGGRRDDQTYLLNCAADAVKQTGYMPVTRDTSAGITTFRMDRVSSVANLSGLTIPADSSYGVQTHVGALLSLQHSLYGPPPYEIIVTGVDEPNAGAFWGADWTIQAGSHQSTTDSTSRVDDLHTEQDPWERTGVSAATRKVFVNQLYSTSSTSALLSVSGAYTADLGEDVHAALWDHRLVVSTTGTDVYLRLNGSSTWLLQRTTTHPAASRFALAPIYWRSDLKAGYRWGVNTAWVDQLTAGTSGFTRSWKTVEIKTSTANAGNWTNRTIDPASIPALSVTWAVTTSAVDNSSAVGTVLANATSSSGITYTAYGPSGMAYDGNALKVTGTIPAGTWMVTTWATRASDGAQFAVQTQSITVLDNAQWWDAAAKASLNFESQQVRLLGTAGTWSDYVDANGDPTATLKAMLPGFGASGVMVFIGTGGSATFQGLYGYTEPQSRGQFALQFLGSTRQVAAKDGGGTDRTVSVSGLSSASGAIKIGVSWSASGLKVCGNGGTVGSSATAYLTTTASAPKLWNTGFGDVPYEGTKQKLHLYDPDAIGGSAGALVSDAILQGKTT